MQIILRTIKGSLVLGLASVAWGCVIAPPPGGSREGPPEGPREGYYDHDHHRYYHERAWHDCADRDEHCR